MSERIIADIRLFRSEGRTDSGHFDTVSFGEKRLIAAVKRIVMKLREHGFSMGDFDHLYINLPSVSCLRPWSCPGRWIGIIPGFAIAMSGCRGSFLNAREHLKVMGRSFPTSVMC